MLNKPEFVIKIAEEEMKKLADPLYPFIQDCDSIGLKWGLRGKWYGCWAKTTDIRDEEIYAHLFELVLKNAYEATKTLNRIHRSKFWRFYYRFNKIVSKFGLDFVTEMRAVNE